MKIIIGMSGGVDSSVAAFVLKKQGHEVIGLSFELWDKRDLEKSDICCSVETIELAKSIAHNIGIEHYTVDVRDVFYRNVIEDFCSSYIQGSTPNPCILCNKYIKFSFLISMAEKLGADMVATGHYARIGKDRRPSTVDREHQNERYLLKKGLDLKKDQSYVLYVMTREERSKTVFPLGDKKKKETRAIAEEIGLSNALRPESQEICFVGNDKYIDFIKDFSPGSLCPGPIVDVKGNTIGKHDGIAFYTIGQRKRLGISSLTPHYVLAIDRGKNTIVAGPREDALKKTFKVRELNWISIDALSRPVRASVKIRSTMREMPGQISPVNGGCVQVEFDEPQWAPAPGQSAVFYDGDIVIGGGIIEEIE